MIKLGRIKDHFFDEINNDDDGYDKYLADLEIARAEAEYYKCWIHTHPFGAPYFSGTDINSVSSWEPLLKEAYVLGGEGHYGSWSQEEPNELQIYRNNVYKETQVWNKGSEEE